MKSSDGKILDRMPVGPLGLIPLRSCEKLGAKVDAYLSEWRSERNNSGDNSLVLAGYSQDSYIMNVATPRFGSGEGKGFIRSSVRGDDIFIMVDVLNHSISYSLRGIKNHMSPDDHFQDLKRVIAAIGGKARRINVIMPFLYESRQHKRSARESLDCATALQELVAMGVDNIITFDAHDIRVQNAIPLKGFDSGNATYQFIKNLLRCRPDLQIDNKHMLVLSPDEGGTNRAIYMANVLGLDMGIFYKRRDYSIVIDGRNPIVSHEYLGPDVTGKDIIILDDMISSGESMIEVAYEIKKRGANRVFVAATFGIFTRGFEEFDKAYENGIITNIITTNLTYLPPEIYSKKYFIECDMSKYIALLIDALNHDESISEYLNPYDRIQALLKKYRASQS